MTPQDSGLGARKQEPRDGPGRAILLTPPGAAAIAVVRLVGPGVRAFLARHFSNPVPDGRCVHGALTRGGQVIDDPVVVTSSGTSVADINLHGGPWVVRSMLELAAHAGFEIYETAGTPLPSAALDADSELESEVMAHLPAARTELGVRALLAQPDAWRRLKEDLVRTDVAERIRLILGDTSLTYLLSPPRVAIVGAANVGKSTLANQLFAQERSIMADVPGTTRDWVGEIANLDGLAVFLVDTPGMRETRDAIERAAIESSRQEVANADLVVLVLDGARPLEPEQWPLLAAYPGAIHVVNKSDAPAAWDASMVAGALRTVATTGLGIDDLRRAIRQKFGCEGFDPARPRWWTLRQREVLRQALDDPRALDAI